MKYIKSNLGSIITVILIAIITFNPDAKSFVLGGLMKTGLFNPSIDNTPGSSPAATEINNPVLAPTVLFTSSSGETIDISASKGKVIFLNFWATWCPPCIAEMPSINSLKSKLDNESVLFLMVDADNNLKASGTFMQKKKYNLPVYGPASPIPSSVFSGALPTTLIINKKGEIVFKHESMADYNNSEMVDFLNALAK